MIFKFLSFTAVFTQSKVHLSDGIDREYTFQNQTSNSFSISAQISHKSVGWNLSDGRNALEHSIFINPSNSAF